jgi:hypothetical protein
MPHGDDKSITGWHKADQRVSFFVMEAFDA